LFNEVPEGSGLRPQWRQVQRGPNERNGAGMSTPKAIIYTRVSTDEQVEGTSLETQALHCLRKAGELAAQIVDTPCDEGVSGSLYASRPGIQKALAIIEAGKANLLIV
jgi:hypothetical protein